ncbi:unnamed protein product [Eruca vesicaria subsp. sativa]|uniref:Uncharacterized protein n=1 Tax=Eruca vesicaria subsp. sativa TaxID=29727 RepID=A0ABC8KUR1_ERUVS|nr:unnamed protein product [Eruca vesicaria subsp. sativa]
MRSEACCCCLVVHHRRAALRPGLEPGAVDVFLEFICHSGGPLPEDLLPQVKCPVLIVLGRAYGDFDAVEEFVVLPEARHCPHDEKQEMVNPLIESFVVRHSKSSTAFTPGICSHFSFTFLHCTETYHLNQHELSTCENSV